MAHAATASTTGTARVRAVASWRPWTVSLAGAMRSRSTESCSMPMLLMGFSAQRKCRGAPVLIPPRMPPALLVTGTHAPSRTS